MSLGNTYNNNQNNGNRNQVTVYSQYRMNNGDSDIDATCLTFRYWRSSLMIGIFPRKNTGNDEMVFDMDNGITIYLSHTKARILKHEIELFLKDPITYNNVGVNSGQAIITISNGIEYGKEAPVVTIRKIDEAGNVVASFAYEFHRNYHFSVRNYEGGNNFDKVFDDYQNLELEQFITQLDQYVKASTNAGAFSVMSQIIYPINNIKDSLANIASSLGVELPKSGGNRRNYSNSSFFNNASGNNGNNSSSSNVSYGVGTIDDLE